MEKTLSEAAKAAFSHWLPALKPKQHQLLEAISHGVAWKVF